MSQATTIPPGQKQPRGRIPKAEQTRRTRRRLLDAGRELFTELGYAQTSTEAIVQRAGVTRGALYYQFRDKAGLFAAVFEEVRTARIEDLHRVIQSAEGDLWQRIVVTGCRAFVESASDPSIHRIVHLDGPSVLPSAVRQRRGPGMGLVREAFTQLQDAGFIGPVPLGAMVQLFWAMFFEAGVYVSEAEDREAAKEETAAALIQLFTGLRLQAGGGDGAPDAGDQR